MKQNTERGNFLLITPKHHPDNKLIEINLRSMGYQVSIIHETGYTFQFQSVYQKLKFLCRKWIWVDYNYKQKLEQRFLYEQQLQILHKKQGYEAALVIGADQFSSQLLTEAREKSDKFIAFHNSPLDNCPAMLHKTYLFDRFYTTIKADTELFSRFKIRYAPDFYFDEPEQQLHSQKIQKNRAQYKFNYHPCLMMALIKIHQNLKKVMDNISFEMSVDEKDLNCIASYARDNFICTTETHDINSINAAETSSNIIFDLHLHHAAGISSNIIKGLLQGKKIITSNPALLDQPYYHPNNIFVLEKNNYKALPEFIASPAIPTSESLLQSFNFKNWLDNKLDFQLERFQKTDPLISIIIPNYNNERVILDAIESAIEQSYPHTEIIIVDDGSTDQSVSKIKKYIKHYPQATLVTQKNGGPAAARNKGFAYSRGEFLVFLDGDDRLHKDYISSCFSIFKKMPNMTLVFSSAELFENGKGIWNIEEYQRENILMNNSIPIYAMIRSSIFEEVGGFDQNLKYAEDWELWIRVLQKYEGVHKIQEPLYYYRKRLEQNSLTDQSYKNNAHDAYYEYIYKKHKSYYIANGLSLPKMLLSTQIIRNGGAGDKYKQKYYNEWYRKTFYYFFKRKTFREIYLNHLY